MKVTDPSKYEKTVTVACVNWSGTWGDKSANLKKMKSLVSQAASAGADIVAFPELALSGYECGEEAKDNKPCLMHHEAAETIPGPSSLSMAEQAREIGVYVLFGMPERDSAQSQIVYNSAAVVGPEGVIGSYRKIHLSRPPIWTESYCFTLGNRIPVFPTKYGPIGVEICYDFWRVPELARIQYLKGARIVFNLSTSGSGPGKDDFMTHATCGRAIDSQIFTANCNHVGQEKTVSFFGHSTIAGPAFPRMTRIYAQGGETEELVMATLNFQNLEHWNKLLDLRKEVNWGLIAEEYAALVKSRTPDK